MSDDLWALRRLAHAHRLQDWMFAVLAPRSAGAMLEIGAGIGTFSSRLLEAGADPLVLIEPEPACVEELGRRFADEPRVTVVAETLPDSPTLASEDDRYVFALCQNVLEHIDDDGAALGAVRRVLAPDGEVAVLVPAHPRLFGRLDRRFGHRRRYTRDSLRALFVEAELQLESVRSFNLLGVPGWWLAGRTDLLDITDGSLRVYEALARISRPLEDALQLPFGLSLVARGRKVTA